MEGGKIPTDATGALPDSPAGSKPKLFGKTATLVAVNSAEIECKFYTPRGSQLQDARCVVNYHEIGIYRTANFGKIDPPVADPRQYGLMTTGGFPQFKTAQLTSSIFNFHLYPKNSSSLPDVFHHL